MIAVCAFSRINVSRRQCQLTLEGERLVLEDLDSANGTLVNNRPVRGAIELKAGDQITIGPITFKIMMMNPCFNGMIPTTARKKTWLRHHSLAMIPPATTSSALTSKADVSASRPA